MTHSHLPDELELGYVRLRVSDLDKSVNFYENALGFQLHRRENGTAFLGAGEHDILVLDEVPGAKPVRGRTGLYHFAILVPTRKQLALNLRQIATTETPLQGFSDHLVSEAIYLPDPDGNGIEIYRDRPRDEWPYTGGTLNMGLEPLNIDDLFTEITEEDPWEGMPGGTKLGHMHLHVRSIPEAEEFYRDVVGFDLMVRYTGTASFFSAGGYHHHLGTNIWAGRGVPPAPPTDAGLQWYTVHLPTQSDVDAVADRAKAAGAPLKEVESGIHLLDPSQNAAVFTAE